jgi:hypothetical protein
MEISLILDRLLLQLSEVCWFIDGTEWKFKRSQAGVSISLGSDCEHFNFLHLEIGFTGEYFLPIQSCVIPISSSKICPTVYVLIAAINYINITTISELRPSRGIATDRV